MKLKNVPWTVLVLLSISLAGCGQKDQSREQHLTNHSSGNPLTAPVDYLGAVNQARKAAIKTVDLASLNTAIQMFSASEERYPKDLNELVQKGYIPAIPEPPAGSRFAYNPATGELKIVPQ